MLLPLPIRVSIMNWILFNYEKKGQGHYQGQGQCQGQGQAHSQGQNIHQGQC